MITPHRSSSSRRILAFMGSIALMIPFPLFVLLKDNSASEPQQPSGNSTSPVQTVVYTVGEILRDIPDQTQQETAQLAQQQPAESPTQELPETADTPFTIEIPSISLFQTVIPNVDPSNKDIYLAAMNAHVAHGAFTSLPSQPNGNVYLFAHSREAAAGVTPIGGWFTRIDELKAGDPIIISYQGNTYTYNVTNSFIVDPEEVSVYKAVSPYPGYRALTLQTCYPRGETTQRLIVRAIAP